MGCHLVFLGKPKKPSFTVLMAKSIRSKVKKANRTKLRKIIGEPLKRKQILKTTYRLKKRLESQGGQQMVEEAKAALNAISMPVEVKDEEYSHTVDNYPFPTEEEKEEMSRIDRKMWRDIQKEDAAIRSKFSFKDFVSNGYQEDDLQTPLKPLNIEDEDEEELYGQGKSSEDVAKLLELEVEDMRKVDEIPELLNFASAEGKNKDVVREGYKAKNMGSKKRKGGGSRRGGRKVHF